MLKDEVNVAKRTLYIYEIYIILINTNMLRKNGTTKVNSELKTSKSLETIQEVTSKTLVTRNSYHGNSNLNANSTSLWNNSVLEIQEIKYKTAIESKTNVFNETIKKGEKIENIIKIAKDQAMWDSYLVSHRTFKKALEHDYFYDVISKNDENVTINFLPISTSSNKVLCGIQKFDKIHLFTNTNKNFYITRILFNITMSREDFIKWEAESKFRFQNLKVKKILFEKIQKDLDANNYSILKDKDLDESNLDFFTKELPLVKFKFTEFEF